MKTKVLTVLVFLILTLTGLIFNNSESSITVSSSPVLASMELQQNNRWLDKFYIGAVHDGIDCQPNYYTYQNLDTLGFNIWHLYSLGNDASNGRRYPLMWWPCNNILNDSLFTPVSQYASAVNNKIAQIHNQIPDMRIVMMRPKIEYLCYGQRSDYQCEEIPTSDDLWFYSFNNHDAGEDTVDNSQYGNGEKVRYCEVNPNQTDGGANWVVRRLKANTEQSHRMLSGGNEWQGDSYCDWIIKPRIRIDSTVAHSSQNPTVCKIKVIAQNGSTVLKEVVIKASNFLDQNLNYDGRYLEEYNFAAGTNLTIFGDWGDEWIYKARGTRANDNGIDNKADIKVYWYGNCDMWIDYVRVDNDVAYNLLTDDTTNQIHQLYLTWIYDEVKEIGMQTGSPPVFMKYYMELAEFNNLPCMAYVNQKLKEYSDNKIDLIQDLKNTISVHVPWNSRTTLENADFYDKYYIKKVGFTQIFAESYPMTACYTTTTSEQNFSWIPNTLPIISGNDSILANPISPEAYDDSLQVNINYPRYVLEGYEEDVPCDVPGATHQLYQDKGNLRYKMQLCDTLSKMSDIPFIFMPQAHQWFRPGEVRREPTNEELNMIVNVSASYGARGLLFFAYGSEDNTNGTYGTGIVDTDNNLRGKNFYGQENPNKWQTIQSITNRLKDKWGPYLLKFDNANRHSFIYDFQNERNELIQNTYFLTARTFKPGSGTPICSPVDSMGINPHPEQSLTYDCPEDTYLQVALFNNPNDSYPYFMIVNRRCSPFLNGTSLDSNGGRRFVRVLFDANHSAFPDYNNWNIINVKNESKVIVTFDKTKTENLDLGWYMPGEGRLYKIVPVIPSGGTLVTNEVINQDVNCSGMIYNNGYDITINPNKTLSFSEGAGIEMTGGSFFCGSDEDDEITVTLKGLNGSRWNGITLDECDTVEIYTTKFEDIKQNKTGGGNNFALNLIDCYNFKIAKNLFECKQDSAFGGINSVYISEPGDTIIAYISENTFNMNNSPSPSVEIISSAGITTPLLLQWNEFSTTCDSSIAIIINSVVGGAIKNNTIEGYNKGINSLSSSIDIYENTIITSSFNDAIGILAVSGSSLNIGPNSAYLLGGSNCFSNTGTGTRNIEVVNSYFDINEGENSFNISDNDPQTAYHFYGYFPEELEEGDEDATINCFLLDSTQDEANHDVKWGEEGDNVNFNFDDNCGGGGGGQSGGLSSSGSNNYVVFYIGNGITDTIFLRTYGNGTLYDSLCTDTRKRDYNSVITKCTELLNNYPDSTESLDAIAKLYTASLALDSSGSKMQTLKSFLESLILNNASNTSLINRAFYFIQKCKVALELYQSALQGFQQIINQNPYNYEGLVASWDYAATYLLDSLNGGSGGGEKGIFFDDDPDDKKSISDDDDPYDKQKFTKEDRKVISTNVLTAFEERNKKQVEKIKELEKKTRSHDKAERNNAEKELRKIRVLKEVVKTKHPKNKIAYVKILNKDIQKVFGGGYNSDKVRGDNLIPTEFNLYQNYPNPFNPTTKIKYDLPKQGKVKLIIYDILGREIKRLINNELMPAGRHTVEFTGHHLASGVYFYRLEVNEGKEYLMTKKMVFIK